MSDAIEDALKAQQAARAAVSEMQALHAAACACEPLLEILALDLMADAQRLVDRLGRIVEALRATDGEGAVE
jgi:hypothetical protein